MKKKILKICALSIIGIGVFNSCKKVESSFTLDKTTVWVGEAVTIQDGVSEKTKNLSYTYDFGDGSSVTPYENNYGVKNPSHIYYNSGEYTITQQLSKSRNFKRNPGKSYNSSQTIVVKTVAPSIALSSTNLLANKPVIISNTTNESGNVGYPVTYQMDIIGPNGTSSYGNSKSVSWTPQSSGTYSIILTSTQGNARAVSMNQFIVGGNGSGNQSMFNGTWNVNVSASLTGKAYAGSCIPEDYNNAYSSISISNGGNIYSGVVANTGSTTIGAGNVVGLGSNIYMVDETLVSFSNASLLFNIVTSGSNATNPNGYYKITSASETSIVLTKRETGSTNLSCGVGTYTDVYTITLTR